MAKTSLLIPGIAMFNKRQGETQWPTMRGAKLDDDNIQKLKELSSLVFCEGTYQTNLNKYWNVSCTERFVMWETEFRVKVPHTHLIDKSTGTAVNEGKGARLRTLYLLCWVGNYHFGSIFHCGWQFPHTLAHDHQHLSNQAFTMYRAVATALYGDNVCDGAEVWEFIQANK